MAPKYGKPVPFANVKINDAFWALKRKVNREVTIPKEYEQCEKTGRIDALRLLWKPGEPEPHIFWDSDIAKWIEAASYSLAAFPDAEIDALLDKVIALIAASQQPDGYLNSHYSAVEPDKRFTNLRDCHELYCAGHLIEAAVAHYGATGKRTLLDVVCRYADYICKIFGRGEGQKRGYSGHEEIELALVKLYHATGNRKYLEQSRYFIEERGQKPYYFDKEAELRGETKKPWFGDYRYMQAHLPVREQDRVTGHAVRAMYLYSAMADLARELDDPTLYDACERLWNHLCCKQMYITGGIGASRSNEGFLDDYDLPNSTAYCETCAGVGLVFWAHRMLLLRCDGKYADVMERALYNNILGGASLDGKRFFYDNPLSSYKNMRKEGGYYQRSEWFDCACCPPNYARLLSSLEGYVYSVYESKNAFAVHLYIGGEAKTKLNGTEMSIRQETNYPWEGTVRFRISPERPVRFALRLRIPGWCGNSRVTVNGQVQSDEIHSGYQTVERVWKKGDEVLLTLDMPVRRVYAHPDIRYCNGCAAIQRGPMVYCAEQADNDVPVRRIYLPENGTLHAEYRPDLLGGVTVIRGDALFAPQKGGEETLYGEKSALEPCGITLIPYYAWCNREPGEMRVWIPETGK